MKKCLGCAYENGCNAALKAACDEGGESANFNYEKPMPRGMWIETTEPDRALVKIIQERLSK